MSTTTDPQLDDLTTLRACLEQYVTRLRAELEAVEDLTGDRPGGTPTADRDGVAVSEHLRASTSLARDVLEALTRCDLHPTRGAGVVAHRYGQCEWCGKPISPARLHLLPCATVCQACISD